MFEIQQIAREFVLSQDRRGQVVRAAPRADPFKLVFQLDRGDTDIEAPYTFPSIGLPQPCMLTETLIAVGVNAGVVTCSYSIYSAEPTVWPPVSPVAIHVFGTAPTMTAAALTTCDMTNWLTQFLPDTRLWAVLDVLTGSTTQLTLELKFKKVPVRGTPLEAPSP